MRTVKQQPRTFRRSDRLIDPTGEHYTVDTGVTDDDDDDGYLILRPERQPPARGATPQRLRYLTLAEFDQEQWTQLSREEVIPMENQAPDNRGAGNRQPPTPPRMTKADWLKQEATSVTLSRSELEHVAQLLAAGRVLLRENRPIPGKLRAALTRLGISTVGL